MGRITTGDHPKGVDSQPDVIGISFGQLVLRLGQLPECHCNPGWGFIALFERRDNPSGRVIPRAKLPHPLLRQSRRICAFGRTPSRETLSIRKPQIHQELRPAAPFGGKGGRKDSWGTLQPRRPLRQTKEKPDLSRSVDPKHFALLLIDQPRDFRRRRFCSIMCWAGDRWSPNGTTAASKRTVKPICRGGATRGRTMAK